jgi:hypothetical protein
MLSGELSELLACGLPPLDILIGNLERKASRRGRDDQFPICSGPPYNIRADFPEAFTNLSVMNGDSTI